MILCVINLTEISKFRVVNDKGILWKVFIKKYVGTLLQVNSARRR